MQGAVLYNIKGQKLLRINAVVKINAPKPSGDVFDGEIYEGEVTIVPSAAKDDQILETKNKLMKENVIVKSIPFIETSNPADGVTVYIGEPIDWDDE